MRTGIPLIDRRITEHTTEVQCDNPGCGKVVPLHDVHSFIVVSYALHGMNGEIDAFQCDDEQHFGCSQECAIEVTIKCMREHLHPEMQGRKAALMSNKVGG